MTVPEMRVGAYERLAFIGRGGTAIVYSATNTRSLATVAVKIFDVGAATSASRQLRAAERLAGVEGILQVTEHGLLDDGRSYLVTPFAPGGSMAEHLERFGRMELGRLMRLGARLARALGHAHGSGVLHRDLKPSNVLLDGDGQAVLSDFGASTTIDLTSASETMTVTTLFAAPEVLEGASADELSDIYSLGITLLTMAIGHHPIGEAVGSGLAAVVNRICSDGVPDPSTFGLPDGVASVLRTATALDPDDRYQSAEDLARALTAVADDPATSPPGSTARPQLTPRESRRRRTRRRIGASAALTLIAAAAGIGVWVHHDHEQQVARVASLKELGPPVTRSSGMMGPLYRQGPATFVGLLSHGCTNSDRLAELSIHEGPADTAAKVATPWQAVSGQGVGVFMSWMPCDNDVDEARYTLAAPGRWFVFVARFPKGEYTTMVNAMRRNATSPSPDYTVNEDVLRTLAHKSVYRGWAEITMTH